MKQLESHGANEANAICHQMLKCPDLPPITKIATFMLLSETVEMTGCSLDEPKPYYIQKALQACDQAEAKAEGMKCVTSQKAAQHLREDLSRTEAL